MASPSIAAAAAAAAFAAAGVVPGGGSAVQTPAKKTAGAVAAETATDALSRLASLATPRTAPQAWASYPPVTVGDLATVNFADSSYFDIDQYVEAKSGEKAAACKYFFKEATQIAKLQEVLNEGRQLVYTLYSFRSCGRAIPQVQAHNQDNKEYLYRRTYEVLRPEIGRMIQLMSFRDKLVLVFTDAIASIIPDIRERDLFPSEPYLLMVAHVLDLCLSLDTMKNMKGSMNNDLSMYKRALTNFPKDQAESELGLLQKLAFFLAQPDQFALDIKKALATMSNTYEDILHDMINLCVDAIETNHYLIPTAKHVYLRAMAFAVALLDGESDERDITKRKKLKLDKLGKIFKAMPFVPLFGDIVVSLPSVFAKAPHIGGGKWDLGTADDAVKANLQRAFKLSSYIQSNRIEYREYIARATMLFAATKARKTLHAGPMSADDCKTIYETALTGLRLMSDFTAKVIEQAAYKFTNPAVAGGGSSIPDTATSYELAVRYNYDSEDKRVLVEYIAMIKNLAALFEQNIVLLQSAVDRTIYRDCQVFMRGNITEYFASATKKKKPVAPLLKYVRDVVVDGTVDDDAAQKGAQSPAETGSRANPISISQLHFARTMMDFMFNEKSKGMKGGLIKEKAFKDAQVAELQRFFDESFFYPSMMRLAETIRECSDLSNLWFKEFYLELSKQVQFPISTSLPWILTEFILDSQSADTIQYAFYPLDLYNDSGAKTLYDLKSRVIFDEIEAEVNLCFDQFMFKLGQRIFVHYKKQASLLSLPSDIKNELDVIHSQDSLNSTSYEFILKQKDLKLLGRSIDVGKILSQIFNQYLRRSIDVALVRFESSDLLNIVELDSLLESARLTRELLAAHVQLEDYDQMVSECDDSLSLGASNGRILSHTIHEIVNDIIPNFCFNSTTQRFVRSPVFYTEPIQRPHIPKTRPMYLYGAKSLSVAYAAHHGIFKDFFGERHFHAILRILGPSSLSVVVAEISRHVSMIIQHTLNPFMDAVRDLSPKQIYYPQADTDVSAAYDFYASSYKPLLQHGDLKGEILQAFRETGNSAVVVKCLSDHQAVANSLAKVSLQEFVSPEPGQKAYLDFIHEFDAKLPFGDYAMSVSGWAERVTGVSRPTHYAGQLMQVFVGNVSQTLKNVSGEWSDMTAGGMISNSRSFLRIWSSLLFVACVPSLAGGDRVIRELFGDGLVWSGCLFLHFLGHDAMFSGASINAHLLSMARAELGAQWPPSAHHQSPVPSGKAAADHGAQAMRPDVKRFLTTAHVFEGVHETAMALLKSIRHTPTQKTASYHA